MNDVDDTSGAPEILEAHWDRDQVDALLDDLKQWAQVQHVQVRTTSGQTTDRSTTLEEVRELLHRGEAKAVQIRYVFEQESWCDTLMVLPESIRVLRTRGSGPA